jgi:hypothetical protein
MGTWNTSIDADDAYRDVYDCFFQHYNAGESAERCSTAVMAECSAFFSDHDDQYAAFFALGMAQWETKALDAGVLAKIEEIVATGADLRNWQERGASATDLATRSSALAAFIETIRKPRPSKKRREANKKPDVHQTLLLDLSSPDGLKIAKVAEVYVDGEYVHTSATMMWSDGGGSLFHIVRPSVSLSGEWIDSQTLQIRFQNVSKDEVRFGIGSEREAFFKGDRVTLAYEFD